MALAISLLLLMTYELGYYVEAFRGISSDYRGQVIL